MDQQNLTYREMAEGMKVSPQYVASVVTEKKNITLSTLNRFAEFLHVPVIALLDGYRDNCLCANQSCCPHCGGAIILNKV